MNVRLQRKRFGVPLLLAALLLSVMLSGAAAPVSAALTMHGSIRTRLELSQDRNEDWGLESGSSIQTTLEAAPDDQDNILAVIEFSGSKRSMSPEMGKPLEIAPDLLDVRSSYLEVTTPLWYGGPQWLFRLGRQRPRWNTFSTRPPESDGVTISNIALGGWKGQLLYLWGSDPDVTTAAIQVDTTLYQAQIRTAYIKRQDAGEAAVEGRRAFLDNRLQLQVGGAYAEGRWRRAASSLTLKPGASLKVEYRQSYDEGTNPFRAWGAAQPDPTRTDRFRVTANFLNHDWSLNAQRRNREAKGLSISASRRFYVQKIPIGVAYSVQGLQDKPSYGMRVSSTIDLLALRRVGIRADVRSSAGSEVDWRIDVSYGVPKGFDFSWSYQPDRGSSLTANLKLRF